MLLATVLHCWVPHSLGTGFLASFAVDLPIDLQPVHVHPDIIVPFDCRMLWLILLMFLVLSYRFWYVLFDVQSHFCDISFLMYTSGVDGENFPGSSLYMKRIVIFSTAESVQLCYTNCNVVHICCVHCTCTCCTCCGKQFD